MSTAVRQALAAAASSVEGVTVSPHYRQTTRPLDGFVRRDVTNRDASGFGYMVAWQVAVILAQDLAAAELQVDQLTVDLVDALEAEGVVTTAQPVQLALESGTLPALIVTVIREQE